MIEIHTGSERDDEIGKPFRAASEISGPRLPVTKRRILSSTREFSPGQTYWLVSFRSLFRSYAFHFSLSVIASFLFPQHYRCYSYTFVPFPNRFETSAASDAPDEDRGRDRLIGFHVVLSSISPRMQD